MKIETNTAKLSLTPTDTVLVPACVENFEMEGDGKVFYVTTPYQQKVYKMKNYSNHCGDEI